MSEIIERVARKLAGQWMVDDGYGEKSRANAEAGEMWKNFRQAACVALEATREPTEAMLTAAKDWSAEKYGKPIGNDAARGCWQAMHAAAVTAGQ